MRRKWLVGALFGLASVPWVAFGAETAEVEARVGPVRNLRGAVGCLLFAKADGFPSDPKKAMAQERVTPTGNVVSCRFKGLAPGTYAIAVMHDEDGDGQLGSNFVGIPTEGYGASNNVLPALSSPSFEDSRFVLSASEAKRLDITVKY